MTSVLILLSGFDPGSYFIEDDGDPTNGIAQLRGPDGSVILFNIPTEFLTVTASAGRSVIFNLTESFGAADINVGNLTNSAENPDGITVRSIAGAGDVTLVTNGVIAEGGSDASADIVASTLILSAGTGVGTGVNAIETQVSTLEAETSTGGITLTNIGHLTVGGLTDEVVGLNVAVSGNLTLTNAGGIDINEESPSGPESIKGGTTSGNVSLIATGFDSDIRSLVDKDTIAAPGGNITLTAGRDVSLGTQGLNFDNDLRARGSLTINTGRDLNVDGFADLASDGFAAATGGNVIVNAGRDINILNATGTDASIGAEGIGGGDVVLNTGPGGFVRLLATSTSTLFSAYGNVTVNADRMVVSATAGITAADGSVFIQPKTEGWNMDLGSVTDGAFALELSDAELDRIFTSNLDIGSFDSGQVTVSAAISPAAALNLHLRAGTDINLNAGVALIAGLSLRAGDNIFQNGASAITTGGAVSAFADQTSDDGGLGGIATLNGTITAPTATLSGNAQKDTLSGSSAGETISGLAGNDILRGMSGNDTLIGGIGFDTLEGGLGDDFFYVDSAGDLVVELVGEGANDRIFSSVSLTLGAGIDVEKLTTDNNAGTGAINLTGNEIANTIFGNAGANVLNGGIGADTLVGLAGDDWFFVDNAGDIITEGAADGANDRIFAGASYTQGAGVFVERLTTDNNAGVTAINLTGNELVNIIFGNEGDNVLDGKANNDTLVGLGGNDTLIGGLGNDSMTGGIGDDFFFVDSAGDTVIEGAADGANDRVFAGVSYTLAAGVHVERLTTDNNASVAAINLTGNEIVNIIFGNAGANTLDGKAGADTLIGLGGDDFYFVDNAGDSVTEGVGEGAADRIFASVSYTMGAGVNVEQLTTNNNAAVTAIDLTGNELANVIYGNAGANVLDGKAGADTLIGLAGADSFTFTTALGGGNIDAVSGFVVADDTIRLENAVFTGLAVGALAAGAYNTGAAATQADDRILYDNATGALRFDVDGVGGAAAVQFATLSAGLALTSADFIVI